MGEFVEVLRQTWRRFWPNPVLYGWPLALVLMGLLAMVLLEAMFGRAGGFGVLVLLLGMWAFAAMALSGLSEAWAAAARTGRASFEDVSRGMGRFYWRMVGFLGLALATALVIAFVFAFVVFAALAAKARAGTLDVSSGTGLFLEIIGWIIAFGLMLLYGFAPAAIALDDTTTVNGIGRGLGLVGRRFGLVVALLLFGLIVYQLVPFLVTMPMTRQLNAAVGTGAAPTAVSAAALSLLSRWLPVLLLLAIYGCLAVSFVALSLFLAYARNPATAASPSAPAGLSPLSGPEPGRGPEEPQASGSFKNTLPPPAAPPSAG